MLVFMINLKVIKKNIETAFMCHPILETFTKQHQRDVAIHEAVMILKKVNFESNFELAKKRAN